nr:lysozyme inhibitor LprI family protein [uncultured Kingella sp.]
MIRSAQTKMFAVLLLSAAFAAPAWAKSPQERSYPEMDKCFEQPEAANGVTAAMLDCTNIEIDRQEARMNDALAKLIAKHPKKAAQLKKEQANWQRKMKRATHKEYGRTGGTMDLLNGSGLALDMIASRADVLEKRLAQ